MDELLYNKKNIFNGCYLFTVCAFVFGHSVTSVSLYVIKENLCKLNHSLYLVSVTEKFPCFYHFILFLFIYLFIFVSLMHG